MSQNPSDPPKETPKPEASSPQPGDDEKPKKPPTQNGVKQPTWDDIIRDPGLDGQEKDGDSKGKE
ncbi:hypothetical protein Z517_06447 [Fonsecaea pedrosoi CBS 271.37]|uniref:Uncharacterized protein n=1 Tax=Fonsecaea pedrosoi CBS 271.37 TaxID=1442368 RepID=A0A0D2EZQ1_9EURO|nr:uncharacterized protein Z517_06447 [Fonsecaea pedrosoi CBS 271.37]KIW79832.1 hypothetical protein Z517_06447 [Fonsecaea pedrosoi CBS 271.37]